MKKLFSLTALLLTVFLVHAQDATFKEVQKTATIKTDTTNIPNKKEWTKGAYLNIGITQIGNSNWIAAGGDNFSLSATVSCNVFASRKWGRNTWNNIFDINYGLVNTTSLGIRKINDRLDFLTKYGYRPKSWNKVAYSFLGQLRSQLSNGYQYDYFGTGTRRRNSGFFAPAYIIAAPGVDWKPNEWFSLFGSPAAVRWTIVSNGPYSYAAQGGIFNGNVETALASLYGVNPATQNRGEVGTFITATIKKDILKNIAYFSKLDLYFSYSRNKRNINNRNRPDLFWTNQFRFKVNKFINVSYTVDMLYDDDVINPLKTNTALGLQVLSTFGIGFAAKF